MSVESGKYTVSVQQQVWAAEEQARLAQVTANSAKISQSNHTISNTRTGSNRPSEPVLFNVQFLREPTFTTGGSVIKNPYSAQAQDATIRAEYAAQRAKVLSYYTDDADGRAFMLQQLADAELKAKTLATSFRDPIITAGVTDWMMSGDLYVGAHIYLLIYFPSIQATITPPDNGPILQVVAPGLRVPDLEAPDDVARRATQVSSGSDAEAGHWLHWLRFEAMARADQGATVKSQTTKDLVSRMPGVGDATVRSIGSAVSAADVADAERRVQQAGDAYGRTSADYYAALQQLRVLQRMASGVQGQGDTQPFTEITGR